MGLNLSPKTHILFAQATTKVEICLVTEKMKSKKSEWSSIRWLMVCLKARLSILFASVWSYKICNVYRNRWRSLCIMCITEFLEKSVSWYKRLADFLADCFKNCITVTMRLSVLIDHGWPQLSCRLPVSHNLSRRHFVSVVGVFLLGNSFKNWQWVWTTDFVAT